MVNDALSPNNDELKGVGAEGSQGELIAMFRRPSVFVVRRRPFTISKIFSSETTGPIKAKLNVEHP